MQASVRTTDTMISIQWRVVVFLPCPTPTHACIIIYSQMGFSLKCIYVRVYVCVYVHVSATSALYTVVCVRARCVAASTHTRAHDAHMTHVIFSMPGRAVIRRACTVFFVFNSFNVHAHACLHPSNELSPVPAAGGMNRGVRTDTRIMRMHIEIQFWLAHLKLRPTSRPTEFLLVMLRVCECTVNSNSAIVSYGLLSTGIGLK